MTCTTEIPALERRAATSKRLEKLALLADRLQQAAPEEVAVVASYLSGELLQRRTGVGWRSLPGLDLVLTGRNLMGGGHGEFTDVSTRTQVRRAWGLEAAWRF